MTEATGKAWTLTLLTTRGVSATKTYRKNGKKIEAEGYGRAKTFTAETIKVDSKGKWLRKLGSRKNSFVVLGEPVNWPRGERKRRLSADRDGDEATLRDVPRALMPIDVDSIDFDPWAEIDDGEMFALELLERLGLKGVACTWHLTSGHGFFNRYRARLWVELAEPATAGQMKEYARDRWGGEKVQVDGKEKSLVDCSVYQPQQPIYTADPILQDGIPDPVERRVGHLAGRPLARVAPPRESTRSKSDGDDPNIDLLTKADLYIRPLKPGQHMIDCPWEDNHSGESREDDTFYFEPFYNGHDIPAFKCHHDSCADRKWADVLGVLGATPKSVGEVLVRHGRVSEAADETLRLLGTMAVEARLFARAERLVKPYVTSRPGFGNEEVKALLLAPLNNAALCHELSKRIEFKRSKKSAEGKWRTVGQDCPHDVAASILSRPYDWGHLPRIDQVAQAPVYQGHGKLLGPGYHASIRTWVDSPEVRLPELCDREAAQAALATLKRLVREFPFQRDDGEDYEDTEGASVLIATLMTSALRAGVPAAPGTIADAAMPGTGKTTGAKLAHVIATGREPAVINAAGDIEEMRKQLDAYQMQGVPILVIDNVDRAMTLKSSALSQILTEPARQIRVLGETRGIEVPNTQSVIVTGNNVQVDEDLCRRFMYYRLDYDGDPTRRRFRNSALIDDARSRRPELLAAIFTIVAAFEASGEEVRARSLVGYQQWSRWVQQPLVWLDMKDPVKSTRRLQAEEPGMDELRRVTTEWHRKHRDRVVTVAKLSETDSITALYAALRDVAPGYRGEIDRMQLAYWLRKHKGRWTPDGLRIDNTGVPSKRGAQWFIAERGRM